MHRQPRVPTFFNRLGHWAQSFLRSSHLSFFRFQWVPSELGCLCEERREDRLAHSVTQYIYFILEFRKRSRAEVRYKRFPPVFSTLCSYCNILDSIKPYNHRARLLEMMMKRRYGLINLFVLVSDSKNRRANAMISRRYCWFLVLSAHPKCDVGILRNSISSWY